MANNERARKKDSASLVWDTKPRRAPNPKDIEFQTAEVVIPNWVRDSGQIPISFRDGLFGEEELDKQQMNRLVWGDNLLAMQALLAQDYEGKINLIYIDPPFWSQEQYNFQTAVQVASLGELSRQPTFVERLAYKDTWTGGIDSYLDMLYPRLQLMKRLLADSGAIYVHLDWHAGHYVKLALDEIFGRENFRNEIVWCYTGPRKTPRAFSRKHDIILFYSKNQDYTFNQLTIPHKSGLHDTGKVETFGRLREERISQEQMEEIRKLEDRGKVMEDWWIDIWATERYRNELLGFDTQKPEALLERIITASSNDGDFVADFFCGSGTTMAMAGKMGRRWIGCDLSKVAIQVSRTRLVQQDAKPFLIENIGNYQREMIYLSGGRIGEMQQVILKLYGATPRKGSADLGTRHSPEDRVLELVCVGYPDRPVTARKVEELARQAEKLDGTGYKRLVILAWDYDYNYSSELENRLKTAKQPITTKIESRTIPPNIYDYLKKAKDENDIEPLRGKIQFYEKPYLRLTEPQVKVATKGKAEVTIGIERYVVFDLPVAQKEREKLQALIKDNFAVLIDYWAVDWNCDGYTFKSQWQDMRGNGRKTKVVTTQASTNLVTGKVYTIAVRLVDIFGNDAAGTVELKL